MQTMLSVYNMKHLGWESPNISLDHYDLFCDDVEDLPDDPYYFSSETKGRFRIAQGSIAWIINTADVYIYNSEGTWVQGNVTPDTSAEVNSILQGTATELVIPASNTGLRDYALAECTSLKTVTFEGTPTGTIADTAFYNDTAIENIYVPWDSGDKADAPWGATNAVIWYGNKSYVTIPATATDIDSTMIPEESNLLTVEFLGTPTSISADAFTANAANITSILVPWSNGDVANAPWGATNAVITYDN